MTSQNQYTYQYPRPAVTADCIVFDFDNNTLHILLIERKHYPFEGMWALPGGFMDEDENTTQCAHRELLEETNINNLNIESIGTFSDVGRDPRGRTVSEAFIAFVNKQHCNATAGDDAKSVKWFDVTQLPPLAFDHHLIIKTALKRLSEMLNLNIYCNEKLTLNIAPQNIKALNQATQTILNSYFSH